MKHQRRELNVFSMSALDLFASGMGAFVLLAIIALPFFPNTGDSQERIEDLKGDLEAAESRSQNLEEVLTELQESASVQEALDGEIQDAFREIEEMEKIMKELERELAKAEEDSREQELEEQLKKAQAEIQMVEAKVEALQETQAELEIPDLDIVICLDVTGSMSEQIDGLKREISSLAAVLDKISPAVGMGVVAFGDREWYRPIRELDITRTSNMGAIQDFVDKLTPNMQDGGASQNMDGPEAVALALESAVEMSWRSDSEKRYIVVITDNPAYRDRVSAALSTARNFSSKKQHHVSSVLAHYYGTASSGELEEVQNFLMKLAESGNGEYVDAAGGESMLSSILLAVLGT